MSSTQELIGGTSRSHFAAFPVRLKVPLRPDDPAFVSFSSSTKGFNFDGLPSRDKDRVYGQRCRHGWAPYMNKKITDFALAGRGGCLGAKGLRTWEAPWPWPCLRKNHPERACPLIRGKRSLLPNLEEFSTMGTVAKVLLVFPFETFGFD